MRAVETSGPLPEPCETSGPECGPGETSGTPHGSSQEKQPHTAYLCWRLKIFFEELGAKIYNFRIDLKLVLVPSWQCRIKS